MRTRRITAAAIAAAVIAGGGLAFVGYQGIGPLAPRLGVIVTRIVPQAVADLGDGGDPLTVSILFPWPGEGFCSGQFSVSAAETDQEVRVSDVTSREYRRGTCAGVGTTGGVAGVALTLARPVGQRVVVRASDGEPLAATSK